MPSLFKAGTLRVRAAAELNTTKIGRWVSNFGRPGQARLGALSQGRPCNGYPFGCDKPMHQLQAAYLLSSELSKVSWDGRWHVQDLPHHLLWLANDTKYRPVATFQRSPTLNAKPISRVHGLHATAPECRHSTDYPDLEIGSAQVHQRSVCLSNGDHSFAHWRGPPGRYAAM